MQRSALAHDKYVAGFFQKTLVMEMLLTNYMRNIISCSVPPVLHYEGTLDLPARLLLLPVVA